MAAENRNASDVSAIQSGGFNEAAAHGRGKRSSFVPQGNPECCFNEAAAHGRGKPRRATAAPAARRRASMRPRRMAAENGRSRGIPRTG